MQGQIVTMPEGCVDRVVNISRDKCFTKIPVPETLYVSVGRKKKFLVSDLLDETNLKQLIADGEIIVFPLFNGVRESGSSGMQVSEQGYGGNIVTNREVNIDMTVNMHEVSTCTLEKLKLYNDVELSIFIVGQGGIGGELLEDAGDAYLRGLKGITNVENSLMPRENKNDEQTIPLRFIINNSKMNYILRPNYDPIDLNGLIDVKLVVDSSTDENTLVFDVLEYCEQTNLNTMFNAVDNFEVLDSSGDPVSLDTISLVNGRLSVDYSTPLTTGTYSLNLDGVITLGGEQYSPYEFGTAPTFEVTV